eukprot:GEZU01000417.1.p2 GENE.GEZU01000417.1~~GEZU01000417.1.p2  ORF type:complete len:103 (+),score=20.48 GEZU01000417.1:63-371(+)
MYVFCGPREKFHHSEFEAMSQYVNEGGNILFMLGEGGEQRFGTNINYFLEEFGIAINNDAVIRTVYYKYFHPKVDWYSLLHNTIHTIILFAACKSHRRILSI